MFDRTYTIHTGKELRLMLSGVKPLAVFHEEESILPDEEIIPEQAFSPFVENGSIVRETFRVNEGYLESLGSDAITLYVMYALPNEVWRMEAWKTLKVEFSKTKKWNETLERIEGSLLGYSDSENDEHCLKIFGRT